MHLEWEEEEILALQKGGNKSFTHFMDAYNLNQTNIATKYNTIAAEYYRRMLKGYIEGRPINDLPPVKYEAGRIASADPNIDDQESSQNHNLGSPIHKRNSSLDISQSSFSYPDRNYDNRWGRNSIVVNKSIIVSRYSINIEAQNDLNKITILLNENDKVDGKQANMLKNMNDSGKFETELDTYEINDEDLSADKDKYSQYG